MRNMGLFVLALVIVLLMAEFSTFAWVADALGGSLDAITLLLLVSFVGVWMTKRAGLGAARRIRQVTNEGKVPGQELADGVLILAAGVLLVFPGFLTGALGVALLVPPVRAGVRLLMLRRFEKSRRLVVTRARYRDGSGTSEVWDVQSREEEPNRRGGSGPAEIGEPR